MKFLLWALMFVTNPLTAALQNLQGIDIGYPAAWDGDKYKKYPCKSHAIPKFIDGFFLCQLSAAYGNSANPNGKKLTHLIDAIGAVASFHISEGQVFFSAAYYPSRPYKIWNFYDRNFTKSSVPWSGWSDYNVTAMRKWAQVPPNADSVDFHPSLDFWRVGSRVVAVTEAPDWVGLAFDVSSLSNFSRVNFTEENDIFGKPDSDIVPITMPIHTQRDKDGLIWGAAITMSFPLKRFYHVVFTIDGRGVRRVIATYDYGSWNPAKCNTKFQYTGDKTTLPGYMHSLASTDSYLILPITSLVVNPCKFRPPVLKRDSHVQDGGMWGMDFYPQVPMRLLVLNKRTRQFETGAAPLTVHPAMWVSHQLNAYETPDGRLIADMLVYDNHDQYTTFFYTEYLKRRLYPNAARFLRFTIDLKGSRTKYEYLLPQETISAEFPTINAAFQGRSYQWAYAVLNPFSAGSSIIKVNVGDPTGGKNSQYRAGHTIVLHEPIFVPRPSSVVEDDGVLLIKALDTAQGKGLLIIVDAATMQQIGWAVAPTLVPFGFHSRFFDKRQLNLPAGLPDELTTTTTTTRQTTTTTRRQYTTQPTTTPPTLPPTTRPTRPPVTYRPWVRPTLPVSPWMPQTRRTLTPERPFVRVTPPTRFTAVPTYRPVATTRRRTPAPVTSRSSSSGGWPWTTTARALTTKRWTWQPRRRWTSSPRPTQRSTLAPEIRTPVTPYPRQTPSNKKQTSLPTGVYTPVTPDPRRRTPSTSYTNRPWKPYPTTRTRPPYLPYVPQIPRLPDRRTVVDAATSKWPVAPPSPEQWQNRFARPTSMVPPPNFTYVPPAPPEIDGGHRQGGDVDMSQVYREMAGALCQWMPAVFRRLKNVCDQIDSSSLSSSGSAPSSSIDGGLSTGDLSRLVSSLTAADLKDIEREYRRGISFAQAVDSAPADAAGRRPRFPTPLDLPVLQRYRRRAPPI